ncbi:MAG: hypothetical protein ABI411_21580, partial [Tahibacter sp.]
IQFNGSYLNGRLFNGWTLNGWSLNGWSLNGTAANGAVLNGQGATAIPTNSTNWSALRLDGVTVRLPKR